MPTTIDLILDAFKWAIGRPRLFVRIVRDDGDRNGGELTCEVENRSSSVTSLQPEIGCKYYYLSKLRITKGHNRYFVRQADRRLDPFHPVLMTATPEFTRDHYGFSWFRTYTFRPSRGWARKVRIRNALLERLGFPRFVAELIRFRLTGNVRPDPHSSIDDLERLRRTQGPH